MKKYGVTIYHQNELLKCHKFHGDEVNVDEMMDNLEQTLARIIDDISIFDTNHSGNLQVPTLLKIFNSQLIEISLT
ncbi:hypothetical protein C1645_840523 [Glomus cerebriforme]|uniref:Uncharacterized protein n=1 Tax=Glomus cerebriforme TaxID=658196 RepID=A0A397S696_9GLOM|nr:hypothetical protein C1645_840523 [Glomus cerebriforme]